jgi:hypothetical protein
MPRITERNLEIMCDLINARTGHTTAPYQAERDVNGNLRGNPGTYVLAGAYGGWRLERMAKDGGTGTYDALGSGYVPKRELYSLMAAYLDGLRDAQGAK